jgi:hypothetical protein
LSTVTPNFNWPVPTSTDLVKDGATAIEALGDSIDASLVDLKGGTTGQVLAKATNTDMDFAWVAQDDSNAIQNSIVDAKGDLIAASANDTPARLAVGSNGETLVADSSTSTGLRWNPTATMANPIINGGLDIWQRGTSFTGSNTYIYTADRWAWRDTSGGLQSLQQVTSSLPDGFQYGIRMGRASGVTSTNAQMLQLPLETSNSIPYANKTITLSFYAKKGANFSPTQLGLDIYTGTGTNQSVGGTTSGATGWTGFSVISATAIAAGTLTTSWVRYSATATVGSTATQLAVYFQTNGVGTAGADDYIYLTGVQMDLGSVALPFRRSGGTIQGELAACQRYYFRSTGQEAFGRIAGQGIAVSTTSILFTPVFPVTMRTYPTSLDYSSLCVYDGVNAVNAISSAAIQSGGGSLNSTSLNLTVTGATQYRPYFFATNNNTAGYVGFSAEL